MLSTAHQDKYLLYMTATRRVFLASALIATASCPFAAAAAAELRGMSGYLGRHEVEDFIREAVRTTEMTEEFVRSILGGARYSPRVEKLMTPSSGASAARRKNFRDYRERMADERRVTGGADFIEENSAVFDSVEEEFGVPRDIVAAIIGIETAYGRSLGNFRVLNTLCTLSFDYKRRSDFYRDELMNFLLLVSRGRLSAAVRGSYAGAVGLGQFMPSSVRKYALDYDRDGKIDLVDSKADAIGSVANYLAKHGWVRGLPAFFPCTPETDADMSIATGGLTTNTTLAGALKAGFVPSFEIELPDSEPMMVIDLPYENESGKTGTEYRLGTRNLQAILTYNKSYFYACAVADLATMIEAKSLPSERSPS